MAKNKPENSKSTFLRLVGYSKPYYLRVGVAMLGSVGVAGADVVSAKLVQPLIDKVLVAGDLYLVNLVPFIIIGIAAIKGASRYIQEYFIKTAGQLAVQDMRNDLYGHSMALSMGYYSRTSTGTVMSRILNDIGLMQRSAADVLVEAVRESFTLIGLTALAFYTDWKLAAVAFLVLPTSVFPAMVIGRKIKNYSRRSQALMGNLTSVLQETLSGIKVIKAFGTENRETHRFKAENLAFYHLIRKVLKYDSLAAPAIELLASFGIAAVFWYGIHRALTGAISQGELLSFVAAIVMMYAPVKKLTKVSNTIQKSIGAAERVFEMMDLKPEITDLPAAREIGRVAGEVDFVGVTFAYENEAVLHDFTLQARPGEVIALVGPSGAGKSTVAGLLSRFYDPGAGKILVDGQDLREISLDSLRRNLALVDQETFLFHDTIGNNIRYGRPEASDAEVREAARQAFADEFISLLPDGYETSIGDRGLRLSGGQRQRICIARAILRDAPILILDEATSALDTESETMVQKALANLMRNRTTLVIAHRLSTIMDADRIVVMEKGTVTEMGRHEELLAAGGLYRKLYHMQFKS